MPTDQVPDKQIPLSQNAAKVRSVAASATATPSENDVAAEPKPEFAATWIAVAVQDDGKTASVDVLDSATCRHLKAHRPSIPEELEFIRLEKSDGGDSVVIRSNGLTARIPFIAQQAGPDGSVGFPVWSDPMDGLPADSNVAIYNSPMDGISPEEIAAAPVFQNPLDGAGSTSVTPILENPAVPMLGQPDPPVPVLNSPLDPIPSKKSQAR